MQILCHLLRFQSYAQEQYGAKPLHPPRAELQSEGPRAISKAVEKNRGLTPHRRKDIKNPRVKVLLASCLLPVSRPWPLAPARSCKNSWMLQKPGWRSAMPCCLLAWLAWTEVLPSLPYQAHAWTDLPLGCAGQEAVRKGHQAAQRPGAGRAQAGRWLWGRGFRYQAGCHQKHALWLSSSACLRCWQRTRHSILTCSKAVRSYGG